MSSVLLQAGDALSWVDLVKGLGVAGLALLFLYLTNKYHIEQAEKRETRQRDELKAVRKEHAAALEQKDKVIEALSERHADGMQQSRVDLTRHLERQGEQAVRTETVIERQAAATSGLQDQVKSLHDLIMSRG